MCKRTLRAEVVCEALLFRKGSGLSKCKRDAKDGIGAERAFVRRAVKRDERFIQNALA